MIDAGALSWVSGSHFQDECIETCTRVPCSLEYGLEAVNDGSMKESELQLICQELVDGVDCSFFGEIEAGGAPSPILHSDWVLQKLDEIRKCIGISCEGFKDQFKALLITIVAGQPLLARSFFFFFG